MKHRQGFESNSSSSSFILGVKGDLSKDDLKQELIKALHVSEVSPLFPMAKSIVDAIFSCSEKYTSTQEILDNTYVDTIEEFMSDYSAKVAAVINEENWTVYTGSWCNDSGDVVEMMLCETPLNFVSDSLVFEHEAY